MIEELNDNVLFQSVFESSVEGILVVNDKGVIFKANPAAENMFGYPSGKLLQKKVTTLIPGKFEIHIKNTAKQSKTTELNQEDALWGIKEDGSQFSLDVNLSPYTIDGKKVVIAFLRDSTSQIISAIQYKSVQKKIEKKLSEKEGQNKALLEAMPDMLFIQDLEGTYVDCFCADPGKLLFPPEQFIGKRMKDVLPEHVYERIDKAHMRAMKSGQLQITEYELNMPDGLCFYEARVVLLNQHGILTIVRDVTDKKMAELQLFESEAKIRDLIQTQPDLMIVYDKYGNHLEVHAPANFQLAAPYDDHIGKNIDTILPERVCDIIRRGFVDCERTKEIQTVEYSLVVEGTLRHLESRIIQTNKGNFLTVIRDMTSQKLAEATYQETNVKNKAMLQAIPDFLYVLNKQGVYLDAHAPDTAILPRLKEELVGKSIYDILPNELCERIMKAVVQSEKTKQTQILEYSLTVNDELRYYEMRIVAKDNGNFLEIVRDITEKRTIDDSLYLRNSALAAIINGIVITDVRQPDNPIIYANQAFKDTTGYDSADFIGKNSRFLQGEDRDQEEIKTMALAIKNGKPCHVVVRNYKKNGSLFWNEISLTPIYNNNKMLTHFIGVQNDVTEAKKMEINIRTKEERFRLAMSATHDGVYDFDVKSKTSWYNQTYIDLLAPSTDPDWWVSNIHPSDKETIIAKYGMILSGNGKNWCEEYRVKDKDGSYIYIEDKGVAIHDEHGKPIRLIGAVQDISERKRVDQLIKEQEQKLQNYTLELETTVQERTDELNSMVQKLTESNINLEDQIMETKAAESEALRSKILFDKISQNYPMGFVAVVDPDFRIVFIEGEELEELGFKGLSKSKTKIDDVSGVSKKVKEKVKANISKTLKGEHCSFEVSFQNRHYLINTTPLSDQDNKIENVLLVHNNLTTQKQAEYEILNILKREQELSDLKSRFISMASHEFRTPLSAILTSAILIDKQNEAGKEEKRQRHVSKIKSNVHNLVVILNDFLSLSKLEEGKVVAKPELLEVIKFSKSIIDEIKVNKKKGQTIKFKHDTLEIKVFLDPKLLRHIISNLLSNAIKYSDENKKITLNINTNNNHLFLAVADQGIGIPEEDKANMFERFYRANNVTNIQGTGLGLNIVKQYTELMRGSIKFESELNVGSTFYVEFPLNTN